VVRLGEFEDVRQSRQVSASIFVVLPLIRCRRHIDDHEPLQSVCPELINVLPRDDCTHRPADQDDVLEFELLENRVDVSSVLWNGMP
jgi:hypothetical protein